MNNQTSSWSEQLQRIGLSEFTDANREILTDIEASGVMIEENNKALLAEADQ